MSSNGVEYVEWRWKQADPDLSFRAPLRLYSASSLPSVSRSALAPCTSRTVQAIIMYGIIAACRTMFHQTQVRAPSKGCEFVLKRTAHAFLASGRRGGRWLPTQFCSASYVCYA